MTYVIDRIEGGIAICERLGGSENIEIEVSSLPKKANEGSVIVKTDDGFAVDVDATERRKAEMSDRLNRLFDKHRA